MKTIYSISKALYLSHAHLPQFSPNSENFWALCLEGTLENLKAFFSWALLCLMLPGSHLQGWGEGARGPHPGCSPLPWESVFIFYIRHGIRFHWKEEFHQKNKNFESHWFKPAPLLCKFKHNTKLQPKEDSSLAKVTELRAWSWPPWASMALLFHLRDWLGWPIPEAAQVPCHLLSCGPSEVLAPFPQSTHLVSPYQRNWRSPSACVWWRPGLVDSSETKWSKQS